MKWICCQIGAREHYAIPRVLNRQGDLALLITDAWADGKLPWRILRNERAAERFHSEIPSSQVRSFDWSLLRFELTGRRAVAGWDLVIARNEWFQLNALDVLRKFRDRHPAERCTLFAYSYAAEHLLRFAKDCGWQTVLGQIDPGPFEEKLVTEVHREAGLPCSTAAPAKYWEGWRRECGLADRILVNSDWSHHGLRAEGIADSKIAVIPLAYPTQPAVAAFVRTYPAAFNAERALRILFLGQVNLRKGLAAILEVILRLKGLPVEFWMVGDIQIPIPEALREHPQVKWTGAVPRSATAGFYRDSDVFLFPTFSDGFGLTQLEALSWKLPVIASQHCGAVVKDGANGYLLPEVSPGAIAAVIQRILNNPSELRALSEGSNVKGFSLDDLYSRLIRIAAERELCLSN